MELLPEDKHLYVYERNYEGSKLLVICSFTDEQIRFRAPDGVILTEEALAFGNYEWNFVVANGFTTRPYELRVYLFEPAAANSKFGIQNSETETASNASDAAPAPGGPLSDEPNAPVGADAPGGPCPSPSGGRCPNAHTGADEGEPSAPDEPTEDAIEPDAEPVGAIHESPAPAEEDPSTRPEGPAQDDSAPPALASEEDAP